MKRETRVPPDPAPPFRRGRETPAAGHSRTVTARHPHHVWNVDFTVMPTALGYWVPWFPGSLVPIWPFSWSIALVLDHFSRAVVHAEVFAKELTAQELNGVLDRAVAAAGIAPRYLVSDRGTQFGSDYRDWCDRHGATPRFGAVGRHGSIAVIERFIRALKTECLRRILIPLRISEMRIELGAFARWYNNHRPHQGLAGATPAEVRDGHVPARQRPRLEPRARYSLARDGPRRLARHCDKLELIVSRYEERAWSELISQSYPSVAWRKEPEERATDAWIEAKLHPRRA